MQNVEKIPAELKTLRFCNKKGATKKISCLYGLVYLSISLVVENCFGTVLKFLKYWKRNYEPQNAIKLKHFALTFTFAKCRRAYNVCRFLYFSSSKHFTIYVFQLGLMNQTMILIFLWTVDTNIKVIIQSDVDMGYSLLGQPYIARALYTRPSNQQICLLALCY